MRDHFRNLCAFRNERAAVLEFRKRVSWYAKQMHPCQMLKQEMRVIESPVDFESVLSRFLEWRLSYDEDVRQGRRRKEEAAKADLVEAA